jgi:hypothetical protein
MFEMSCTKSWNEKLDFMSIANRPVLSTQGGSVNAQNIRWAPGEVYDTLLQVVQQPPPPVSFDAEIQNTRALAQERVGMPDFGVGQENQFGQPRTATETNAIATVMQQSNDLRARIVKAAMTEVYEQAWKLLLQYKKADLDYFWRGERISLPDAALDDAYVLSPNGSVDGYSRERDIQKLMQLRQLAQGAPWIQLNEIDCKIIELMDAQWINQIYTPPQGAQANEQEKQATENLLLMSGFPAPVGPNDEHLTHLQVMDGFIGWQQSHGGMGPDVMGLFINHGLAHVQAARSNAAYMRENGTQVAQFASKIAATQRAMQQQAQAAQAQEAGLQQLAAQQTQGQMAGTQPELAEVGSTNGQGQYPAGPIGPGGPAM